MKSFTIFAMALATGTMAVPVPDAAAPEVETRDGYTNYGTYDNYGGTPPPPTTYTEYGTYDDYPSTYATYTDYPSSYANYGTYKRFTEWVKNIFT